MATVKQGTLAQAGQFWKHLRPYGKRVYHKRERDAVRRETREQLSHMLRRDTCAN